MAYPHYSLLSSILALPLEVLGNVAFCHRLLFAPESPERVTLWLAINRDKDVTDIQAKGQD